MFDQPLNDSEKALINFLHEPGKNRPLSLDHPTGSAIRYIKNLEQDNKELESSNAALRDRVEKLLAVHEAAKKIIGRHCWCNVCSDHPDDLTYVAACQAAGVEP